MPLRAPVSGPIRSADEASAWLDGLVDHERRPRLPYERLGLEPVRRLLERLGDPQRGLRVLHVAGSKGKGSTVLLAEAILRAAGERVGSFTSPHLERWTERFRVDGCEVAGARLAAVVERLRPHVEALRDEAPERAPTFFDVTTAAALLLFREEGVEHAVVEVGLGGRLDSTNAVEPVVTCVTAIELEHTAQLGTTLAAIAGEKAGILKPGVPVVAGALPAEALAVVEERAARLGAPLARLGRELDATLLAADEDGLRLALRDGDARCEARVPVLGAHQAANAALAFACARRARPDDAALPEAAVRGLAGAVLPGRMETLERSPRVIVDAAHTPVSAAALAAVLETLPRRRRRLVLSLSEGKDVDALLRILLPHFDAVTLTRALPGRSLAPAAVAAAVRALAPGLPARVVPNPHLALRAAREGLADDDLLVATGSFYLAGIARRVLRDVASAPPVAVTRRRAARPAPRPARPGAPRVDR